jgi:hypothetical protein
MNLLWQYNISHTNININTMTTTTYIIFAGEQYYPSGGFEDLYGTSETLEGARAVLEHALRKGSPQTSPIWGYSEENPCDWGHIVDMATHTIIVKGLRIRGFVMDEDDTRPRYTHDELVITDVMSGDIVKIPLPTPNTSDEDDE